MLSLQFWKIDFIAEFWCRFWDFKAWDFGIERLGDEWRTRRLFIGPLHLCVCLKP